MQVSEALVLVAGVLLIQASGMPTSTEPRKKHKPGEYKINKSTDWREAIESGLIIMEKYQFGKTRQTNRDSGHALKLYSTF